MCSEGGGWQTCFGSRDVGGRFGRSGSRSSHRRKVGVCGDSRFTFRVRNIWNPAAALFLKIGIANRRALALSHDALSDIVGDCRETSLGSLYGQKKLRERT